MPQCSMLMVPTTSESRPSGSTSARLIQSLKAGEPDAWRRLVRLYGPAVYRWCHRWPLPPEDVADVFQDVFASVARFIGDFRRDQPSDTLRGWLWTITRSRAADQLRRMRREPSAAGGTDMQQLLSETVDPLGDDDLPPAEVASIHEVEALVRAEFEERTWQLFSRSVMDGQATAQVALEFGVTPGAVRQARYRVLKRLRDTLGEID